VSEISIGPLARVSFGVEDPLLNVQAAAVSQKPLIEFSITSEDVEVTAPSLITLNEIAGALADSSHAEVASRVSATCTVKEKGIVSSPGTIVVGTRTMLTYWDKEPPALGVISTTLAQALLSAVVQGVGVAEDFAKLATAGVAFVKTTIKTIALTSAKLVHSPRINFL